MRKPTLPAAVCAFVFFALLAPAFGADVNQLYLDGVNLYQAGKYSEAEERFGKVIRMDPSHTSAIFMMGESVSKDIRRLTEAESWYLKTLSMSPNDQVYAPKALYSLGSLYMRMGKYNEALKRFGALKVLSPDFFDMPKVLNQSGVAYYFLDMYDEAMNSFKASLKLDSGMLEATFNMKSLQGQLALINTARYHQRLGNEEEAIRQYTEAIETYPNYVAAWYQLGMVYLNRKDYDEASRLLARAWALNPQYMGGTEVAYQLANAYAGRGEPGDLENALILYQDNLYYKDSLLRAGKIHAEFGQYEEAELSFTAMTEKAENKQEKAEAWYQLGLMYNKLGEPGLAGSAFRMASGLMPDDERYKPQSAE